MTDNPKRDWRELARLAATEQDPQKLLNIITELNAALLEKERRRRGAKPKALVVDDDTTIRQTLIPVLQKRGYEAEFAGSVPNAVSTIEHGIFDVLVRDLNIDKPGDGFGVVKAMRKTHPRSVIVLFTGYPGFDSALEGIRQDVDDYLVKPVDYDVLIKTLEARLSAQRAL